MKNERLGLVAAVADLIDAIVEKHVDRLYTRLVSTLSPPARHSHRITHVDVKDVEQSLRELADMRADSIYGVEGGTIGHVLEMLYKYGVDEAQATLFEVGDG